MQVQVPTFDLARWRAGSAAERAALARDVDAACGGPGFMQVIGHGIAASVLDPMRAQADAFFALPTERKLELRPPHPGINRGYAPRGSEALAYSLGAAVPAPDLFEAFNLGPDTVPDDAWYAAAPHHFFAPNLWPAALPEFRPALNAYFDAAVAVGLTLTDVFAAALDLPERWFRPYVDRSTLTLRVNHYERRAGDPDPAPGQMRMGAHTDYGVVTVLYADAVPGLQILGPDGAFYDVIPRADALLVNLGDLTAQWTNDRWRSTLHRVVPPPAASGVARRRSVALFLDANYDARIECIASCCSPQRPARYAPLIAGEHLIAKILGPRTGMPSGGVQTAAERYRG